MDIFGLCWKSNSVNRAEISSPGKLCETGCPITWQNFQSGLESQIAVRFVWSTVKKITNSLKFRMGLTFNVMVLTIFLARLATDGAGSDERIRRIWKYFYITLQWNDEIFLLVQASEAKKKSWVPRALFISRSGCSNHEQPVPGAKFYITCCKQHCELAY